MNIVFLILLSIVISLYATNVINKNDNNIKLPVWNTTIPNLYINKSAGLRPIIESHYTIINASLKNGSANPNGTYNHLPVITYWSNLFYVAWANKPKDENQTGHTLLSSSTDAKIWSKPIEILNPYGTYGWQILNNRLYICSAIGTGPNSSHETPSNPLYGLMRQIYSPNNFGDIFWLNQTIPQGFEYLGFKTYLEMDNNTKYDMEQYIASSVDNYVNESGTNYTSVERSMYMIPESKSITAEYDNMIQLMLIIRTSPKWEYEFAATCFLSKPNIIKQTIHSCNGIGGGEYILHNNAYIVDNYSTSNIIQKCNWTHAMETNIPDGTSRTCTAYLPDNRIYLLGNQLSAINAPNGHIQARDVLMFSISNDGFNFNQTWALRYNPPPLKFPGYDKNPGFEYPAAVWIQNDNNFYVVYSVNKEDIQISIINLDQLEP